MSKLNLLNNSLRCNAAFVICSNAVMLLILNNWLSLTHSVFVFSPNCYLTICIATNSGEKNI